MLNSNKPPNATEPTDTDVTLTPEEAAKVRKGEKQLKKGLSSPWREVKRELERG